MCGGREYFRFHNLNCLAPNKGITAVVRQLQGLVQLYSLFEFNEFAHPYLPMKERINHKLILPHQGLNLDCWIFRLMCYHVSHPCLLREAIFHLSELKFKLKFSCSTKNVFITLCSPKAWIPFNFYVAGG